MWKCSESEGNVVAIKNSRIQLCLSGWASATPQSFREQKERESEGETGRNGRNELKGRHDNETKRDRE